MTPTMPPGGSLNVMPSTSRFVAVSLRHRVGLDHDLAEARARRDVDFKLARAGLALLVEHRLVGVDARLALGLPRLRRHANPLQLALQGLLPLALGLLLAAQALLLLFEPRRVVALPRDALAAVEFENPARDVVEEVAVVRDGDDRALVALQVLFEPRDRLRVEVVRRLVEQQDVRLHAGAGGTARRAASRRPTRPSPASLPAGSAARPSPSQAASPSPTRPTRRASPAPRPAVRGASLISSSDISSPNFALISSNSFKRLTVSATRLFDHLAHGLRLVEPRLLFEVADRVARRQDGLAREALVRARDDAQQRGLARAVEADDADLRAVEVREVDVLQHRALVVVAADADHRVDDFVRLCAHDGFMKPPGW